MRKILQFTFSLAFIGMLPSVVCSQESPKGDLDFCYSFKTAEANNARYAIGGTGSTDVAIKIPREFYGATLKSIKVPVNIKNGTDYMEKLRGWASTTLNGTVSSAFTPTLASVDITEQIPGDEDADIDEYRLVDVVFPEPIAVPSQGLYVGYSFSVSTLPWDEETERYMSIYPIMAERLEALPEANSFYMRYIGGGTNAGRSFNWEDRSSYYYAVSLIEASLTDVNGNEITLSKITYPKRVEIGEEDQSIDLTMYNRGFNGISELEYEFTFNGKVETVKLSPDAGSMFAAGGKYNASYSLSHKLPAMSSQNTYPYTLKITKINGQDVSSRNLMVANSVKLYSKLPVKRPVIEENTGTRCPYCTRGFYALEVMNRLYDDLIAISYHNSWQGTDPMAVLQSPPYSCIGNPDAYVDRMFAWGDYDEDKKTAGMEAMYHDGFTNRAAADVQVECEWTDDTKSVLKATAKVNFPLPEEMRYRIDLALIEDGMTGKSNLWKQSNGYLLDLYGKLYSEPEWDKFATNDREISGLVYNDIFVAGASNNMKGVLGSLPATVEPGKDYEFSHEFVMDEVRNAEKSRLVQDKTKLRVVALLIYSSENTVNNAAQCKVPGYVNEGSGVEGIGDNVYDADAVPEAYYDLTGREVRNPENGIYIVRLSDGRIVKRVIR